ncbi:MAG: hypothetical protein ACRCVV_10420 [Shewanella sp.]
MDMFQEKLKSYEDQLEAVTYRRQAVRDPSIGSEQIVDQLMVYKHGFFINCNKAVVEICPTVSSYSRGTSCLGNGIKIGVKLFINGDEVLSIKEVQHVDDWIDYRNVNMIEFVINMVILGYLKSGYDYHSVLGLLQACTQSLGIVHHSSIEVWTDIPFDDGSLQVHLDDKVYWCMRKYSNGYYITKYMSSSYRKHLECPGSKVVISEKTKEALPVTLQEALDALS